MPFYDCLTDSNMGHDDQLNAPLTVHFSDREAGHIQFFVQTDLLDRTSLMGIPCTAVLAMIT